MGTPVWPVGLACVSPAPVFPPPAGSPSPTAGGTPRAVSDSALGVLHHKFTINAMHPFTVVSRVHNYNNEITSKCS